MPGSVIFDTAVGLMFVFLTASLICSAAIEWLGNKLNKRGEYLLRGLREMLDIPPATPEAPAATGTVGAAENQGLMEKRGRRERLQQLSTMGTNFREHLTDARRPVTMPAPLADLVLAHPTVAALHRPARPGRPARRAGKARFGNGSLRKLASATRDTEGMHLASYLSAPAFARSLIDLLTPPGAERTVAVLAKQVARLPVTVPARDALLALLRDAGDINTFRRDVEQWYDEQMGRVSGWYKRWAQWRLLIAGGILALVMNVDTVAIGRALYEDEPVRNAAVAQAVSAQGCPASAGSDPGDCLRRQQELLRGMSLPIGWNLDRAVAGCRAASNGDACWGRHLGHWVPYWWHAATHNGLDGILLKLLGWLLTALAVSFGAPFWFDALSKLGSLRTAGRRPGENDPYRSEPRGPEQPARTVRRSRLWARN